MDSKLQRVQSIIEKTFKDRKIVARSDNSSNEIFPVAINATQGKALCDWIVKEEASQTIEVGLAWGLGALHICEGLLMKGGESSHHIALDPFQAVSFKNCALQLLEEAGVSNLVEHLAEESQLVLPRFVTENRRFDFAFVDGSHLFDRVFLDLIYLGRLVRPEGIIFADDYQASAVAKAVSFCVNNLGWRLEETGPSDQEHQWVVLRTVREPIPRSYPHFVNF